MVGDDGQRPCVSSVRRRSHHCQRLLRKQLVEAATYLMRPVYAGWSGESTRFLFSATRRSDDGETSDSSGYKMRIVA